MLPTCIGISGVSRYRNEASIEDSFLESVHVFLPQRLRGALVALLAFRRSRRRLLALRTLVRIVHFPGGHMQWQTAPNGQIA
jgi:hypothetical protein